MADVEPTFFRWPLDSFDERFAKAAIEDEWESPEFEVEGVPKAKFSLSFFPKGECEQDKDGCGMYLNVRDFGGHPFIRLTDDYWLENGAKEQLKQEGSISVFDSTTTWAGWSQAFAHKELLEHAKRGPLVLFAKITPLDPVDAVEWAEHMAPSGVCRKIAANFDSKKFADVEVHVGGRVFPVNKMIICSGSPVFERMFDHKTKERESGVVDIEKEDADLIELLLRFLYSGQVEGLKDVAARLLPVADCYEVLDLVEMCLVSLIKNVFVSSVVRDLKLAFAHDHQGAFKRKLLLFARKNFDELVQQPDWTADFMKENSEIAFQVTVAPSS